ncbi:MAG: hypothetical protein PHW82_13725 [Bacteroidales bacterium]|nr:hypothetical protein [Bacteroidales bacterium]
MKISRKMLLLSGFIIIALYFSLNRINDIQKSEFTYGTIIGTKEWRNKLFPEDSEEAPIVHFIYENQEIVFVAQRNTKYENGENVKVVFRKKSPDTAKIYSFTGYWLIPIIICSIPIILYFALILSFVGKFDFIVFNFREFKLYKKADKNGTLPSKLK